MTQNRAPLWMFWFWVTATLSWWGFAFMPTGEASPEWLAAARNACFGTLPNGLPDTSGWLVLILGPGSFLIALFVAWHEELLAGLRTFSKSFTGIALIFLSLAFAGLEASWVGTKVSTAAKVASLDFRSDIVGDLPFDYPRSTRKAVDFTLIDQAGKTIRLQDKIATGKSVVLSFAFAHCQSICPALIQQLKEGLSEIDQTKSELLLITLDPRRDTPSSLPQLAEQWELPSNAHILSGKVVDVENTLRNYQVLMKRNAETGNIDHPALIYIISPQGELSYTLNNVPPRWIAQAVRRVIQ